MADLLKDLVAEFDKAVNTTFDKNYQELEPELKKMAYTFPCGNTGETTFPVSRIFSNHGPFKGNRVHNSPADVFTFKVENEEYDGCLDVARRDFLRASNSSSPLRDLRTYQDQAMDLGKEAKDAPYEKMLDLLVAGEAATYGTTFDGQNFFDTTHDFNDKAGTQSNLLTGTGVTLATLLEDIKNAANAIDGFTYSMNMLDPDAPNKLRYLNKGAKLTVVCDASLKWQFKELQQADVIGQDGATTNVLKNTFDIITRPFADKNDWYLVDLSQERISPFIVSMEEEPIIKGPEANAFQNSEHKVLTWGLEGHSFGVGYGAWWKAVKTTNA